MWLSINLKSTLTENIITSSSHCQAAIPLTGSVLKRFRTEISFSDDKTARMITGWWIKLTAQNRSCDTHFWISLIGSQADLNTWRWSLPQNLLWLKRHASLQRNDRKKFTAEICLHSYVLVHNFSKICHSLSINESLIQMFHALYIQVCKFSQNWDAEEPDWSLTESRSQGNSSCRHRSLTWRWRVSSWTQSAGCCTQETAARRGWGRASTFDLSAFPGWSGRTWVGSAEQARCWAEWWCD